MLRSNAKASSFSIGSMGVKRKPASALDNSPLQHKKCDSMAEDAERMISTLPPEEKMRAKKVLKLIKDQKYLNVVSLCSGSEIQESMGGSSEH